MNSQHATFTIGCSECEKQYIGFSVVKDLSPDDADELIPPIMRHIKPSALEHQLSFHETQRFEHAGLLLRKVD